MTGKQRVYNFISSASVLTSHDLETWAVKEIKMSASSALRHARTLIREGLVEHPDGDIHRYKSKENQEELVF